MKYSTAERKYVDTYRTRSLRTRMVSELRTLGIKDEHVLQAIGRIPRHYFLDTVFNERAYENRAFPIEAAQTISHPYTVAFQTQLLNIKSEDRILEIGTGSGYQACVLQELGGKIYTIERQQALFKSTSSFLSKIGYDKIRTLYGDGYEGAARFAPFDKIIVTAGATEMPKKLMAQLKIGGFMVIPFGNAQKQEMILLKRNSDKDFSQQRFGTFQFVPFLKGTND